MAPRTFSLVHLRVRKEHFVSLWVTHVAFGTLAAFVAAVRPSSHYHLLPHTCILQNRPNYSLAGEGFL